MHVASVFAAIQVYVCQGRTLPELMWLHTFEVCLGLLHGYSHSCISMQEFHHRKPRAKTKPPTSQGKGVLHYVRASVHASACVREDNAHVYVHMCIYIYVHIDTYIHMCFK